MLFGHGDDYYRTKEKVRINYSSNVWYGANTTALQTHLYHSMQLLERYPEPDAGSLRELLAEHHQLRREQLLVTNGSITAFYLIAQAYAGSSSLIFVPSFAEYEDACRLYHHRLQFFPVRTALSMLNLSGITLCWICNPNNPDGSVLSRDALLALIRQHPSTTFIIDQVYGDFYPGDLLTPCDVLLYPNLVLIQSISKLHKIPGIRIGYIAACEEFIKRLELYLIPWSVNALAVEAGKYVLSHPEQFPLPLTQWLSDAQDLQKGILQLGIQVVPSALPFFLCRLSQGMCASSLKSYLLEKSGILIRDASNFRTLDARYFRLSTQRPAENRLLLEALQSFLAEHRPDEKKNGL